MLQNRFFAVLLIALLLLTVSAQSEGNTPPFEQEITIEQLMDINFRRTAAPTNNDTTGTPIILIPGIFGTSLWEQTPPNPPPNKCKRTKQTKPDLVWIAATRLVSDWTCVEDIMSFEYTGDDSGDGSNMYAQKGAYKVDIPPGTKAIDFLDPLSVYKMDYANTFFEEMEAEGHWVRDKNLRGFGYSWLVSPTNWEETFQRLEKEIIDSYESNGNRPAIIMTHSNGGPFFTAFMRYVNYDCGRYAVGEFGQKYIKTLGMFAPAHGGSPEAFAAHFMSIFGYLPDWLARKILPEFVSAVPGSNYLLPRPDIAASGQPILTVKKTGETFDYTRIIEALRAFGTVPEHVFTHFKKTDWVMKPRMPAELYPVGVRDFQILYNRTTKTPVGYYIKDLPDKEGEVPSGGVAGYARGDGTMLATTMDHYVNAYKMAYQTKRYCPSEDCKFQAIETGLTHTDVLMREGKHHWVHGWVMRNLD